MRHTIEQWNEYYALRTALTLGWQLATCPLCGQTNFIYHEEPDRQHNTFKEVKSCNSGGCQATVEIRTTKRPYDPNRLLIYADDNLKTTQPH